MAELGTKSLPLAYKLELGQDPAANLVYLIHGRAGTFDVMWTFRSSIQGEANIIAPEAPHFENLIPRLGRGASWWMNEHEGSLTEKSERASELLFRFMQSAETAYGLTPRKRLAFGFSQGAALLSHLIQKNPEFFTGVALLSGFVIEAGDPQTGNKPAVFVAHGTEDDVITLAENRRGVEHLRDLGYAVEYHTEAVGHKVGSASIKALRSWYQKAAA